MIDSNWAAGKLAVISGAASGLGSHIAAALAERGAEVWSFDTREPAEKDRIEGVTYVEGDVTSVADVERFCARLADKGPVSYLVHNAGVGGPAGKIESLDPEAWARVLDVNLTGQMILSKYCFPLLQKGPSSQVQASVVFMSSAAGRLGYPLRSPYAASKWGVVGLVKTLAWELGREGVRVNAVLPGIVDTELSRRVLADRAAVLGISVDELRGRFLANNALPEFAEPADVVGAALFLLSPSARRITAHALNVDCGIDSAAVI